MACKMCKERGQTWSGSPPTCYFDSPNRNWNCATVNAIRDIFAPDGWWVELDALPKGVTAVFAEDTTYGLIKIDDIDAMYEENDEWVGCLYVQWYKRRGATDSLWILGDGEPRKPTEAELLAIIRHYKEVK